MSSFSVPQQICCTPSASLDSSVSRARKALLPVLSLAEAEAAMQPIFGGKADDFRDSLGVTTVAGSSCRTSTVRSPCESLSSFGFVEDASSDASPSRARRALLPVLSLVEAEAAVRPIFGGSGEDSLVTLDLTTTKSTAPMMAKTSFAQKKAEREAATHAAPSDRLESAARRGIMASIFAAKAQEASRKESESAGGAVESVQGKLTSAFAQGYAQDSLELCGTEAGRTERVASDEGRGGFRKLSRVAGGHAAEGTCDFFVHADEGGVPTCVLKPLDTHEQATYERLKSKFPDDTVHSVISTYHGVEQCDENDDASYIRLGNLLLEFDKPRIMDVKLGTRCFLDAECPVDGKPREDLYKKMEKFFAQELTDAERASRTVTKRRYMSARDAHSTSQTFGFRISGTAGVGGEGMHSSASDSLEAVQREFAAFTATEPPNGAHAGGRPALAASERAVRLRDAVRRLQAALTASAFARCHECIGTSILLVADATRCEAFWIDFAKVRPRESDNTSEDGVLLGLENMVKIWEQSARELRAAEELVQPAAPVAYAMHASEAIPMEPWYVKQRRSVYAVAPATYASAPAQTFVPAPVPVTYAAPTYAAAPTNAGAVESLQGKLTSAFLFESLRPSDFR